MKKTWWVIVLLAKGLLVVALPQPVLSEFMASSQKILADEDGDYPDWIEIYNPENVPISMEGYHLSDRRDRLRKWAFPKLTLNPGAYLVVFASGKDRNNPDQALHTNFKLSSEGGFLALVDVDGETPLFAWLPAYPPQYPGESFAPETRDGETVWSYHSDPTPGQSNTPGEPSGPLIEVHNPNPVAASGESLLIEVTPTALNGPVKSLQLFYRFMYEAEQEQSLNDEGAGGDRIAHDGVWSTRIPAGAFEEGKMTRWRFVAQDHMGHLSREPGYRDRLDSHQYFGTVLEDPSIESKLPVFHWFTRNPRSSQTLNGYRGSVYYRGEFYDNVHFNRHGQSTADFPKKSFNIDFNRSQRFKWSEDAPRVADIDLITNWADKSKVRHVLAYEIMRESGVAAHFAFTIRVQQNGAFFSTADFIEDADDIYLKRAGLDERGALYKIYDNTLNKDAGDHSRDGVEKKNRKNEDNSDLQSLIDGLDLRGSALNQFHYDHIDIPGCVNLLAANSVIRNMDMHRKNWYLYRDTEGNGEWAILPWDLDLSHGRVWNSRDTYFDNRLYTDGFVTTGTSIRLVSQMFADSDMRSMILRRIRTLVDRFLQPNPSGDTPESELYYERRLNEQLALLDPPDIHPSDADLDFEKWGSWLQGGQRVPFTRSNSEVETMEEAIERWKQEYLPGRRRFIYERQIVGQGGQIPLPQIQTGPSMIYTALIQQPASVRLWVPSSGELGLSWAGDPANEPFDDGYWILGQGGVGYDRGTRYGDLIGVDVEQAMRQRSSIYLRLAFDVPDPSALEHLELRLKYDDGFVAYLNGTMVASGNAPAQALWSSVSPSSHAAHPRLDNIFDLTGDRHLLTQGTNMLAIHGLNRSIGDTDFLMVPELYAGQVLHPNGTQEPVIQFGRFEVQPSSGIQDEEYVELINGHDVSVDLSGWQLAGAISHTFKPGTVLAPQGRLFVTPDVNAFRRRNSGPRGGMGLFVQGNYRGHLSNLGETIELIDSQGAINQRLTYESMASDVQRYLRITELMYHPTRVGGEFIEMMNISPDKTLDLQGVRWVKGVVFDLGQGRVQSLSPGERLLVVQDQVTFEGIYGSGLPVAGEFDLGTALSNGGEVLKLEDKNNATILEFRYDDTDPWPDQADGEGWSLVAKQPEDAGDWSDASSWTLSAFPGGTPGRSEAGGTPGDPKVDVDGNGEWDWVDQAMGNLPGMERLRPSFERSAGNSPEASVTILSIPVNPDASGLRIAPLFSMDLLTWSPGADQLTALGDSLRADGRTIRRWQLSETLSNAPQLFMKVRVDFGD